jgi:hypothetical protein
MTEEPYEYDIALSFAGEDRTSAEEIAELLSSRGIRVFYDLYEQAELWGKDLYQHLQTVYKDKAEYCVIFASKHYAEKLWTKHELRQAQARAFSESREYILPLRLDDTEIPGVNHTVGYIDLRKHSCLDVAHLICRKVWGDEGAFDRLSWKGETVNYNGTEVASFWPKRIEEAQKLESYPLITEIKRIPYGSELGHSDHEGFADVPCHDCAVIKGQYHVPGCDMEECPQCKSQLISCDCQIMWDGEVP